MASKIKGLQQWCRKMTEGYQHVDISNFTTAWRNGMAFCAIIHRFRPDLIDYDSLSPENVFENNKLAFEVGESELNIPAFLEADDMARLKVPDKLSVITYVSQYYNYLSNLPQLGGPGVKGAVKKGSVAGNKRPPDTTKVSSEPSNKKTVSAKEEAKNVANNTTTSSPRKGTVGDKCGICQNKVYLLERHIDSGKLYHRSCFRHSDLSPTNKVYNKSPFMSPSLNNEKAMVVDKPYIGQGIKAKSQTVVSDNYPKNNNINESSVNRKENDNSSVLANLKSGLKKVEVGSSNNGLVVGSKHSMQADKDKDDDAKKAKVQPKNLFGVGGGTGKENLNNIPSEKNEPVFPLSGKEAKKLEKRRQEILASETSTPLNKGAKRTMPLLFQNKDKSEPSPSSTSSSSSSSYNKISSSSDGSGDGIAVKHSSKPLISLLDSKIKDSKTVTTKKGTNENDKGNAIQNLQQKFSGQSQPPLDKGDNTTTGIGSKAPGASSSSNQPVARPRIAGSKIASSPFLDNDGNKKGNDSVQPADQVAIRNKKDSLTNHTAPVAAPRKSVGDSKFVAQLNDKSSKVSNSSHLSVESSSSEDNSTPRSARSKLSTSSSSAASTPPPALPASPPPPLPQSRPPPLPTSPPPVASTTSTASKQSSSSHVSNDTSKSSLSSSSNDIKTTKSLSSSAVKDRKDLHHVHPSTTSSSSSLTTTTTTAKISLKPVTPAPPRPPPPTTLVSSNETKGEGTVLSGLLASLAGVRGRSASTPNPLVNIQQQPPASAKDTATATPKFTSKLTSITTTASTTPSTQPLSVTSSTTSNRKLSEPIIKKGDINVTVPQKQHANNGSALKKVIPNSNSTPISSSTNNKSSESEAMNVLHSLKPVSKANNATTTTSTSGSNHPSENASGQKLNSNTNVDFVKPAKTNNENKVGSLVKNYLSKSKEDLSLSGNQHPKEAVLTEDKKLSKPPKTKDANKDQLTIGTNNASSRKEEFSKKEDGQSKLNNGNTSVSSRYDVKLKKVGIPMDLGKMDDSGSKQVVNNKTGKDEMREINSTSDVPQWKKDIEERKKKLRDDIIRSETPSKRGDRNDKEKSQPRIDVPSKQITTQDVPSKSDESTKSDKVMPPSPRNVVEATAKENNSKLNWQLEAERRMAAFAHFDSEEESKSKESDDKIEDKIAEMNNDLKKRGGELKVNKLKDNNEFTKFNKIGLKTVDINIDGNESNISKKELSKPQSINNNNSLSVVVGEKPMNEISSPLQKFETVKKVDDGKLPPRNGKTIGQQASPKASPNASPKLKRKITVLGPNNQKTANQQPSVSPPTTPSVFPEKKKIAVIGKFDFDNNAPSDFESSLSQSTEQMSIEDHQTPQRPPRTKSQRSKADSPKQISAIELQQQLMEIDNRLTDLELRGRDLEDSIRNASFQEGSSEGASSNSDDYNDDDDHLMMEWFQLVSEKNDLVRQEADLVYLSREQELEDEQEQLDHQLRYLMGKDDLIKSPQEKEEEAYLLQRKVDIVNQRSNIIDSMDEDRLRYEEEDRGIEYVLKSKGLWKDDGTFLAEQGKTVGNSTFFA